MRRICAVATVVVALQAVGLVHASAATTRPFNGTWGISTVKIVPQPRCPTGQEVDLDGVIRRRGRSDWQFAMRACESGSPGSVHLTTARGTTLDGNATGASSGTALTLTFDIVSASREYLSGHLVLTVDIELGAPGTVSGQLIVA